MGFYHNNLSLNTGGHAMAYIETIALFFCTISAIPLTIS